MEVDKKTAPAGDDMRKVGIAVGLAMAGLVAVAVIGDQLSRTPPEAAPSFTDNAPADGAKGVLSYSKATFEKAVYGKTKQQIRDMFGSPDNVNDSVDTWYYWNLPVYDEAAGTKVHNCAITFDGSPGAADWAVEVRY